MFLFLFRFIKYLCAEKEKLKEIMEGNQSRRIDFVDLTKGVCIILVVMAHVGGAFEQLDTNSMLSCFRMPLYFFISGVFFKSYEGLFGFILRKINKLIIPFLFFYLSALFGRLLQECFNCLCRGMNSWLYFMDTTLSSSIHRSGFYSHYSIATSCFI